MTRGSVSSEYRVTIFTTTLAFVVAVVGLAYGVEPMGLAAVMGALYGGSVFYSRDRRLFKQDHGEADVDAD